MTPTIVFDDIHLSSAGDADNVDGRSSLKSVASNLAAHPFLLHGGVFLFGTPPSFYFTGYSLDPLPS